MGGGWRGVIEGCNSPPPAAAATAAAAAAEG